MKIANVEAWLYHFPLAEGFRPAWIPGYTSQMNSSVIYRLTTDEGPQGPEGITAGVAFADEAKGPINLLRVFLQGLDIEDTDEVYARLQAANRTLGFRAWFIEAAFWDLKGKAAGRSVADLLGAKRKRLRAYASTGSVRNADEAAEHAAKVVAEGFQGIKIRTRHATLDEDIAMLRAVREAIGPDVALMCDANQAWRVAAFGESPVWDLDRALAFAKACEGCDVAWLEEPLDMYDLKGYAELRARTSTPIAAGELNGDPGLVRLLMEAGGVDIVQPDLVFTGGITGAHALASEAHHLGLAFTPHTWTNGVGLAANLQVACAAPNCEWLEFPYDPPGWLPESRDSMLTEPILVTDGAVELPDRPGLGFTLDLAKLDSFATPL